MLPQCTSLPVRHFTACHCLRAPKRKSPYSLSNSERYSSLVKSVMSRVSAQTPETLLAEDEHIYGPVIQGQTASTTSRPEKRVPKTLHPFFNNEKIVETEEAESSLPARILLDRGPGRGFLPSVSRILQQTLSPEQIFYLERWKKRMIAELGEDGFKEYSQSKYCNTNVTMLCLFLLKSHINMFCFYLDLFRQGRLFHSALEDVLMLGAQCMESHPLDISECPPDVQGYMKSISHILEDVRGVRATESTVQHDSLNYLGIVDCVARYR